MKWLTGRSAAARLARLVLVVVAITAADIGVLPDRVVETLALGLGVPLLKQ